MNREVRIITAVMLCSGCVAIHRDVKIVDYPEGARHIDRVVYGSRTYHGSTEIHDDNLVVRLTRVEVCEEADVPILRRKRLTTRTEVPSLFGIQGEWLTGAGGMVLGGLMAVNPERACSQTTQDGTAGTTNPQTCVTLGWTLVGLGAVVTTIAIVDSIRVSDDEQDLGTHDGEYVAASRECHPGPVVNTAVELRLAGPAGPLRGRTSQLGEVAFSMIDVDTLPSPSVPASVVIAGETIPVTLTEQQRQSLAHNLLDNPHSRLARDAAELVQKTCTAAVGVADRISIKPDTSDDVAAQAQDAWRHAKGQCAAHWTAGHQQRLEVAEKAITQNRSSAVLMALNAGDLDRVDDVLAKNPGVIESLRDDPDVLQSLRGMIGEPARALVSNRRGDAGVQHRLCRARQTFVRIRGTDQWDRLKVEIAKNISELGSGTQSTLVRLMDAARCE